LALVDVEAEAGQLQAPTALDLKLCDQLEGAMPHLVAEGLELQRPYRGLVAERHRRERLDGVQRTDEVLVTLPRAKELESSTADPWRLDASVR
jgi:hypothetical protein